jgi:hypothetical protein
VIIFFFSIDSLNKKALNADAWVTTGGTYAGVMKEVGDMFEKWTYKSDKTHARVPVIGISSWYFTTGKKNFTLFAVLFSDALSIKIMNNL